MTLDLDALEESQRRRVGGNTHTLLWLAEMDVTKLIAECRRLKAELATAVDRALDDAGVLPARGSLTIQGGTNPGYNSGDDKP